MKRNGFVLTAGIFYIFASISLLYISIYCGYSLWFGENLFYDYTLSAPDNTLYLWAYILLFAVTIVKFIMFVVFFVLGIIVIIKSKTFDVKPSKVVSVTMILGYICAVIDLNLQISQSSTFLFLLISSILLSVAISKRGKNQNIQLNETIINEVKNQNVENDNSNLNEIDNISKQVKSLQALKDSGIITDEDYIQMLSKLVNKSKEDIDSVEEKKRVFRVRCSDKYTQDKEDK